MFWHGTGWTTWTAWSPWFPGEGCSGKGCCWADLERQPQAARLVLVPYQEQLGNKQKHQWSALLASTAPPSRPHSPQLYTQIHNVSQEIKPGFWGLSAHSDAANYGQLICLWNKAPGISSWEEINLSKVFVVTQDWASIWLVQVHHAVLVPEFNIKIGTRQGQSTPNAATGLEIAARGFPFWLKIILWQQMSDGPKTTLKVIMHASAFPKRPLQAGTYR